MEALALQPELAHQNHYEQLRYDLRTQFAEIVDGNMRTNFELQFNGHDLIGEDGRGMDEITSTSLEDAKDIAKSNPDLWFERRRRSFEREEFQKLIQMARGDLPNTMVVVSDFPPELADADEDIGGYNISRKQTMLRVLTLKRDGNIQMYSQSLDGSNREALEAIYSIFEIKPEAGELLGQRIHVDVPDSEQSILVDKLTGTYDRSMSAQYGGEWHAGRRPATRNTYDFVCEQHDLIEKCIQLQEAGQLNNDTMFEISATMQKRFESEKQGVVSMAPRMANINPEILEQEIRLASAEARTTGMSFSACGVTLRSEGVDGSTENQMNLAGYGNKSGEDKYGSLTFECQKGHKNTRPRDKLIEKCKTCGISVKC